MSMIIKIKHFLLKVIAPVFLLSALSIVAAPAFAEDAATSAQMESSLNDIFSMPINVGDTPRQGEYAHYYFNKVFGGFIFTPWGEGSNYQLSDVSWLSKAIGFTNVPALILGVIILFYSVIGGAINTASSGEVLGKSWSSIWLPIRTASGFGLIMPADGIGKGVMSISQLFIIWLILIGSNAGSVLYKNLIDDITGYDPTLSPPLESVGFTPSVDILKMLVCADVKVNQMGINARAPQRTLATVEIGDPSAFFGAYSTHNIFANATKNGGYSMSPTDMDPLSGYMSNKEFRNIKFGPDGSCGSISGYVETRYTDSGINAETAESYKTKAVRGGMDVARDLMGKQIVEMAKIAATMSSTIDVSKTYFAIQLEKENPIETEKSDLITIMDMLSDTFTTVANSYATNTAGLIHQGVISSDSFQSKFNDEVKAGGWFGGGLWYYELGEFSSLSPTIVKSTHAGISFKDPSVCSNVNSDDCQEYRELMHQSLSLVDYMASKGINNLKASGTSVASLSPLDEAIDKCGPDESCNIGMDSVERLSTRLAKWMLNLLASSSSDNNPVGSTNANVSPFQTVSSIGHSLNTYAGVFWVLNGAAYAAIESTSSFNSSIVGEAAGFFTFGAGKIIAGTFMGTLKWLALTIISIIMMLSTTGFVLAYLIPFLPVITWITMIAGYLITVVEAPVAIPLAVIQAVAPEGEGIMVTRLERAMQLLSMSVLKPSLMVIGLVASIHLANIVFQIMNDFFFRAAEHVLYGSIFDFAAVILLYTMVSFSICKLMITVMHKLPEQILDWFASGVGRSFGENEAGQVGEQAASGLKQTTGSIASGLSSSLKERIRERKADDRMTKNQQKTQ